MERLVPDFFHDFVYFFLNQAKCLHVFFSTILCIYIVYFLDKDILIYNIIKKNNN